MKIIVYILCLFLFSCSTLKTVKHNDNKVVMLKDNLHKLDGQYEIFADDTSIVTLDRALTLKKYWWRDFAEKNQYRLFIKTIDQNHLKTDVFKNDKLIASNTSKFLIVDGDIIIKKNRFSPFYLIVNFWGSMTTKLILLENGNLKVDHHNYQLATFVIIPLAGGSEECYGLVFKRLSNSR